MPQLVSTIIPMKNCEDFIIDAVDSILADHYPHKEVIIVDDNSSDGSAAKVLETYGDDPRVRLVRSKKNLDIAGGLNLAIEHAKGEFVARMDADDLQLPDRFSEQVAFLAKNPDVSICGGLISEFSTLTDHQTLTDHHKTSRHHEDVALHLNFYQPLPHPTWLVRRSVFEQVGLYRDFSPVEDYDFLLRVKAAGLRIVQLNSVLVRMRVHEQNSINSRGISQLLRYAFLNKNKSRINSPNLVEQFRVWQERQSLALLESGFVKALYLNINTAGNSKLKRYGSLLIACILSRHIARRFGLLAGAKLFQRLGLAR